VALLSVPFFHVTGAVPLMLTSLAIARTMVLMPKWDAGEALRLIERHKVTYFLGVPTMSLELLVHPERDNFDLSSLTDLGAGGAPRPAAHVERMRREMGAAQPALGYGLTETNATGCSNFWTNYAEKPESTGRAQPFVEVAIMDDARAPVPTGAHGEVALRSAANMRGYWRNEAATRAAVTEDGWFLTGDIGYLDEDGYLFIVDRKKDIIIRGGENISCQEVEAAIYAHPAVAEACVFGLADERLGEVPGAVVYLEPGETLDAQALKDFVAERLAAFKQPAAVWVHEEPLPKLGTGKIDKVGLRERYRVE
jgi:acyl-CoA synthetase (AMP-forming)/AMP-acid ligase II